MSLPSPLAELVAAMQLAGAPFFGAHLSEAELLQITADVRDRCHETLPAAGLVQVGFLDDDMTGQAIVIDVAQPYTREMLTYQLFSGDWSVETVEPMQRPTRNLSGLIHWLDA